MVNEACILSVRYKLPHITEKCFVDAFEKTTIGLPKQTDRRPKENIKMVAYHEAGHTIGALFFKDIFDVRRVTINANNSGAGGYTLFTPKEEVVQFPTKEESNEEVKQESLETKPDSQTKPDSEKSEESEKKGGKTKRRKSKRARISKKKRSKK